MEIQIQPIQSEIKTWNVPSKSDLGDDNIPTQEDQAHNNKENIDEITLKEETREESKTPEEPHKKKKEEVPTDEENKKQLHINPLTVQTEEVPTNEENKPEITVYPEMSTHSRTSSSDEEVNNRPKTTTRGETASAALKPTTTAEGLQVQPACPTDSTVMISFRSIQESPPSAKKKNLAIYTVQDEGRESCNLDTPQASIHDTPGNMINDMHVRINEIDIAPTTTKQVLNNGRISFPDEQQYHPSMPPPPTQVFTTPQLQQPKMILLPLLEGYLKKQTTGMMKNWQPKYFLLENRKLFYFKNHEKGEVAGCIDMNLVAIRIEIVNDNTFKIIPLHAKREFVLKAENQTKAKMWVDCINEHIFKSRAHVSQVSLGVKLKDFWKYDRISPLEFLNYADNGDLILFKTKHPGAALQRSVTGSDFDHVALLLRYQGNEIVLFEAAFKTGVSLCRWSTFLSMKWQNMYSKMMYRKLRVNRDDNFIRNLEEFVKFSVGKKYSVNLGKIFKKKGAQNEDENRPNKTFFCSELIAACYKRLGLLPGEVASGNYLPGAFSQEKNLALLNNATLDHQKLIDFTIEK